MSTENVSVALVEAATEITKNVLDKMSPSAVNAQKAAEVYKIIYKAVIDSFHGE